MRRIAPLLGILGLFVCLLLVTAVLSPSLLPVVQATVPTSMPTTMYDNPGPPGDFVSRTYGGWFHADVGVDGTVAVGKFLILGPGAAITVTNGTAFTPTATYQPIAAASTVTPTITILQAGTLLRLINTGTGSIVLQDTGIQKLNTTRTLGQYDVELLLSDGTNWIEMASNDN
jgi:hypothetical protein